MTKSFDDAAAYCADIRRVMPGYDLLRELAVAALAASLPPSGRLLVVGCGPGDELVELAQALPGWHIDAVEPSSAMASCAVAAIAAAKLSARVHIYNEPLAAPAAPRADAALCLLVAHLVPGEQARADFWRALGDSLAPCGELLLAEIERMHEPTRAVWRAWAGARGCGPERLATLDERLTTGFAVLPPERTAALAAAAGLDAEGLLFRVLGLSLRRWRRRAA